MKDKKIHTMIRNLELQVRP